MKSLRRKSIPSLLVLVTLMVVAGRAHAQATDAGGSPFALRPAGGTVVSSTSNWFTLFEHLFAPNPQRVASRPALTSPRLYSSALPGLAGLWRNP